MDLKITIKFIAHQSSSIVKLFKYLITENETVPTGSKSPKCWVVTSFFDLGWEYYFEIYFVASNEVQNDYNKQNLILVENFLLRPCSIWMVIISLGNELELLILFTWSWQLYSFVHKFVGRTAMKLLFAFLFPRNILAFIPDFKLNYYFIYLSIVSNNLICNLICDYIFTTKIHKFNISANWSNWFYTCSTTPNYKWHKQGLGNEH